MEFLDDILNKKNIIVSQLIDMILSTPNHEFRKKLIFALIDNFKDDRIIPMLIQLIKRDELKNYNGVFIFACNEYSANECKPFLELFIDIVINGNYEASMSAASLILDFSEPYNWSDNLIDEMERRLKLALDNKSNNNEIFIKEVLEVFKA